MADDGGVGVAVLVREPLAAGGERVNWEGGEEGGGDADYFVMSACPVPV